MLSELEEIINYKQYADQPERQQIIKKTWMRRYPDLVYFLRPCMYMNIRLIHAYVSQIARLSA